MNPLKKLTDITGPAGETTSPRRGDPLQMLALSDEQLEQRRETAENSLGQEQDYDNPSCEVARWVRTQFDNAKQNKQASGVIERDQLCLRHRRGEYSAEEAAQLAANKQEKVFFPMPDRHCRSLKAFIRNILTPDDNHPLWDLKATPIPEVPDAVARRAAELLVEELSREAIDTGVPIDQEALEARIGELRGDLLDAVRKRAQDAVDNIQEVIEDNLLRTEMTKVIDTFLDDFVGRPAAILKGPEVAIKKEMVWENGRYEAKDYKYLRMRTVDPDRIYPSADSTTTQDGEYIMELGTLTRGELSRARRLTHTGYIAANIELLLREYEGAPRDWLACDGVNRTDTLMDKATLWAHDEGIDVLMYSGRIEGRMLKLAGIDRFRGKEVDEMEYYEVVLWVVDTIIIRATCANDPLCQREYHKAVSFPITGSFWGQGLPWVIKEFTRMSNASVRSLVGNMGFISKPIFEVDNSRMDRKAGQAAITNIVPGQIVHTNSAMSGGNSPAVSVFQISPIAGAVLQVLDTLSQYAEEMSGLPSFLSGQPASGGAARTLGGFNQLSQNVGIGLKSMVVSIDQGMLEPVIGMMYRFLMATAEDPALMADAQVRVYGATQLLAREMGREKHMQAVNISLPFAQSGLVKQSGVSKLLADLYESLGLDPDEILVDPDQADARQEELRSLLGQQGGVAGGVPAQSGPGGVAATQTPPVAPVQPQAA